MMVTSIFTESRQGQEKAAEAGEEDLLIRALTGGTRFRRPRFPILWRKGHAPKSRTRRRKFQTDLGPARAHGAEEDHVAFLFFLCPLVFHKHLAAAGDPGLQQDERAVGIDGERLGFFLEGSPLR